MDQESGYQWVAVRSVMISCRLLFYFWTNLPQVWWPRGAGITHLSERCRWPNNFNSICNNNSVRQIKIKKFGLDSFLAKTLTLSFVVEMATVTGMCMQPTRMDILALCMTMVGEQMKQTLCAGIYIHILKRSLVIDQKFLVFRQLGFQGDGSYHTGSYYGSVEDRFAMVNVDCRGTESYLQDCSYSPDGGWGMDDGAGVYCWDSSTIPPSSTRSK